MTHLRFFSQVVFCCGYTRFLVLDTSNGQMYFFPSIIGKIISDQSYDSSIEIITESLDNCNRILFQSVIDELIENELAFVTDTPDRFPKIQFDNHGNLGFENAHIFLSEQTLAYKNELIMLLNEMKIKAIKLDFTLLNQQEMMVVLQHLNASEVHSIECVIDLKNEEFPVNLIDELCSQNGALTMISIINHPLISLDHSSEILISNALSPYPKIVPNFNLFCESVKNNPYFNGKLYIGSCGEIKMAENTSQIYGYLKDRDIGLKIKNSIDFRKFWNISKDSIDICKDCEFRYMCIDNRYPRQRKDKSLYFVEECRFNPYISKWSDEVNYIDLNETGISVTESITEINHQVISKKNKEVWQS